MLKRLTLVVLLATVVAVVSLLMARLEDEAQATQEEEQGEALPLPVVMECFSLTNGNDPIATVLLNTKNFGFDLARVRTLVLMCEGARKVRGALAIGAPGGHVFACYRLEFGQDPDDPFFLDTPNFPNDKVRVRKANLMCESARKVRGALVVGHAGGHVLQCFALLGGQTPNAAASLTTRNFGADPVVITTSIRMCEEASKTKAGITIGAPTGVVWQCYNLLNGVVPNAGVTLTTQNFGQNPVTVGAATSYCERATKTRSPTF